MYLCIIMNNNEEISNLAIEDITLAEFLEMADEFPINMIILESGLTPVEVYKNLTRNG